MDLDDLLDDVEIPDDEEPSAVPSKHQQPATADEDLDSELSRQMEEQALLPFVQSLNNVPSSMADRWIAMVKADARSAPPPNKLLPSACYRSWDSKDKISSNGVSRACSDIVRSACVKSGFDDAKIAKMVALVNPLEGESAQRLQGLYAKQLLSDLRKDIERDQNFTRDTAKFPHLKAVLSS